MSDYEVRPATMRDAKAVAEVHALAAKAAYEGILPEEELRVLAPASREAKWREAQQHWKAAQQKLNALLGVERVLALHQLIDESLELLGTDDSPDLQD